MYHCFSDLIRSGSLFWFCALAGSGMFLIQFLINIFGMAADNDFGSSDAISHTAHHTSHNLDIRNFKWLSVQAVTGFLMVFGWTAITCQNEFGLQDGVTMGISLVSGLFAALIIRSILKLAKKLTSSGNIYRIEDTIGKEGYVYQCIPKEGKGKISVSLENLTHEIEAISRHYEDLPSFTRIKIIEKSDDHTVVVTPLSGTYVV